MSSPPPTSELARTRLSETADLILSAIEARHGEELRSDPKFLREALFAELRRRMAAPTGRRRSRNLDLAEALRKEGKTYHQIAALLNPEYGTLTTWQRQQYRERLKKGIKGRKKRAATLCPSKKGPDASSPTAG